MEKSKDKKRIKYSDLIDRMKKAAAKNNIKSNTNTPDAQARQDKIQDLENRSGQNGKKISWAGLR